MVHSGQQVAGQDHTSMFMPTPALNSFRFIMAIRTHRDMVTYQVDWKGAYLNAMIDHEVYVQQPVGMEVPGKENLVCRLNKAVYGACQSGRLWNLMLDDFLTSRCGLERCPFEPCLYRREEGGKLLLMQVHTDDGAILVDRGFEWAVDELLQWIEERFEIKRLGELRIYLALRVEMTSTRTTIDQESYCQSIIEELHESEDVYRTPWGTDMDESFDEVKDVTEEDREYLKGRDYWRLVGKLQYLVNTRPDIAYAVGKLGRFASKPRRVHWDAGQRVLGYLRGTKGLRMTYMRRGQGAGSAGDGLVPECFADADFRGDRETQRSTTGIVITLCGGVVVASSKRQTTVADSTTAAETIVLHSLVKEGMWVQNMLT